MFKLLWKYICSFFTADKIGQIIRTILLKSASSIMSQILQPQNQEAAVKFVKQLNVNTQMTTSQKAAEFNRKMIEWVKEKGKPALKTSVINCLRQLAVNTIKAQLQN